jgi:uncharacterized Fe-S center protein
MAQKVYFASVRAHGEKDNKASRIRQLFDAAGLGALVQKDDLVAVKLHFGESGCDAYIRPPLVRQVVDKIKQRGGKPFLTDAATLYSGSRHNAVDHAWTAVENGFDIAVTGAPVIIADGLKGSSTAHVEIDQKHFKTVRIAADVVAADALISLAHFKGHMQSGFGGAMKNVGMGAATPAGKRDQHGSKAISGDDCKGCGSCGKVCPEKAITMVNGRSKIELGRCIGCGECMTVCPNENIEFNWETEAGPFAEKMMEYTLGVLKNKKGKAGFMNFLLDISPECDCVPWSDAPIVPDVGILASTDPVAIDRASFDLVNQQAGFAGTALKRSHAPGQDKFRDIWPKIDTAVQFSYAEKIGLGTADYKLVEI